MSPSLAAVTKALTAPGIDLLPSDNIPADFAPTVTVEVTYADSGKSAGLGNHVTPTEGAGIPTFSFAHHDPAQLYTLVSIDPDAPSRVNQMAGPWRHAIIAGLTQKAGESNAATSLPNLTPWIGPGPPVATGDHRYMFLLYKESKPLLPIESQSTIKSNERIDRRNFDCATFVKENGLTLVGANFFISANPVQTIAKA